jgi:ribosome-binding protein aMBF1 (putative translation factor)
MDDTTREIAKMIVKIQRQTGWNDTVLAGILDVKVANLTQWKQEEYSPPAAKIKKIKALLGSDDVTIPTFRKKLLEIAHRTSWTNAKLATKFGVTERTIKRWKQGSVTPGADVQAKINNLYQERFKEPIKLVTNCGFYGQGLWFHSALQPYLERFPPEERREFEFTIYQNLVPVVARELSRQPDCHNLVATNVYITGKIAELLATPEFKKAHPSGELSALFNRIEDSLKYQIGEAPSEDAVSMMLAAQLMDDALHGLEVAILLIGDQCFVPFLQTIRRSGVHVALASLKGSCDMALCDPDDSLSVRDFEVIWLDSLLDELTNPQLRLNGNIKHIFKDPLYLFDSGYIRDSIGRHLFFCEYDLSEDLTFEDLQEGQQVSFLISRPPSAGRAGIARDVCPLSEQEIQKLVGSELANHHAETSSGKEVET